MQAGAWPREDLDFFILAQLEANQLKPAPAAAKRTLIRRATYDLTGLPPTMEEIADFLADESPDAFRRVVDRLLPAALRRKMERHWLDVAPMPTVMASTKPRVRQRVPLPQLRRQCVQRG